METNTETKTDNEAGTCPSCDGPIPSAFPQHDRDGVCYSCADMALQAEMEGGAW